MESEKTETVDEKPVENAQNTEDTISTSNHNNNEEAVMKDSVLESDNVANFDKNVKNETGAPVNNVVKGKGGRKPKARVFNFSKVYKEKSDNSVSPKKCAESDTDVNADTVSHDSDNTNDGVEGSISNRRGHKRKIYNDDDDAATKNEKIKKRAIEVKLKKLKSTFNEPLLVSGKRQKKAPQRFELAPTVRPRPITDSTQNKGIGQPLGDIRWIIHEINVAPLNILRLLHRVMYHRKGLFVEKIIKRNVLRFSGFPFGSQDQEFGRRKEILQKVRQNVLKQLCQRLCLRPGSQMEMVDRIMNFLLRPSAKVVEDYIQEKNFAINQAVMARQAQIANVQKPNENMLHKPQPTHFMPVTIQREDDDAFPFPLFNNPLSKIDLARPWKKPGFFIEGSGIKLKYIRAVIANIEAASDAFVELLHRLLFLNVDEKNNMRRNILEFSGLNCDIGTPNYVYRVQILSVLPLEQLKLICKVLCLPTWHKSRHILTDSIMDFLNLPRISAMKKRVPPVFSDEISFSFDNSKANKVNLSEFKSDEMEEIEIVPDIHIPDENMSNLGLDHMENEYFGVKLKNFSNIHYQVISTHTSKLSDLHMILYLTSAPARDVRKNILEFSGFAFDENTTEHLCRRTLLEQYNLDDLKRVASILCVSQYICDDSKKSLIDAILKFLLKPSALLSSSTMMPTISQNHPVNSAVVVKKEPTSSCEKLGKSKQEVHTSSTVASTTSKDTSMKAIIRAIAESETKQEVEKVKACLSNSAIEITPIPAPTEVREGSRRKPARPSKIVQEPENLYSKRKRISTEVYEGDEAMKLPNSKQAAKVSLSVVDKDKKPLSSNKKDAPVAVPSVQYLGSDDDDDQPLSKMIGHPNDDQLKVLVSKIMRESRLEDVTMKHVIKKVFEAYPNYDLNYRKEFIKSNVRLILSQMGDQSCSVSTTVINI